MYVHPLKLKAGFKEEVLSFAIRPEFQFQLNHLTATASAHVI